VAGICNSVTHSATLTVQAAGDALLTISRVDDQIMICWPASCAEYVLESTPELGTSAEWVPVEAQVDMTETSNCVIVPLVEAPQFYRLRRL
jgi:hypothetical protein